MQLTSTLRLWNGRVELWDGGRLVFVNSMFHRRFELKEAFTVIVAGRQYRLGAFSVRETSVQQPFPPPVVSGVSVPSRMVECVAVIRTWSLPNGATLSQMLYAPAQPLYPPTPEDSWAFCTFTCTADEPIAVRWFIRGTIFLSLHQRGSGAVAKLSHRQTLSPAEFAGHRFWFWRSVPPDDLFVYASPDHVARVRVWPGNSGGQRMVIETIVQPTSAESPSVAFFWEGDRTFSGNVTLVSGRNWQAAAAATCTRPAGLPPAPEQRYEFRSSPGLLWYDGENGADGEGLAVYLPLITRMPVINMIVVWGPIHADELSALIQLLRERPPHVNAISFERDGPREKIRLFLVAANTDAAQHTVNVLQGLLTDAQRDAESRGTIPDFPRVSVWAGERSERAIDLFRDILFRAEQCGNPLFGAMLVVPYDPAAVAASAALARYLAAAVLFSVDGALTAHSCERFDMYAAKGWLTAVGDVLLFGAPDDGSLERAVGERLNAAGLVGAGVQVLCRSTDAVDIAGAASRQLLKTKLLDRSVHFTLQGISQAPTEDAVARLRAATGGWPDAAALEVMKRRATDHVTTAAAFHTAAQTYCRLPSDVYRSVVLDDRIAPWFAKHHVSPVEDPALSPQVILAEADLGDPRLMLLAASHSAARYVPLLLVPPPTLELERETDVLFTGMDRAAAALHNDNADAEDIESEAHQMVQAFATRLYKHVPAQTLDALDDCLPQYLTLFTASRVPYELIAGPLPAGAGWPFAPGPPNRFVSVPWQLFCRIGRLGFGKLTLSAAAVMRVAMHPAMARESSFQCVSLSDSLGDLPWAAGEAYDVLEVAREQCRRGGIECIENRLTGAEAKVAAAERCLATHVNFIHVACHSIARGIEPACAGAGIQLADGELKAADITGRLSLSSLPLVLLNVCSSGRSADSLAGSFAEAGASAVVASLWPVHDRTSRSFAKLFTAAIISGSSAGAALQVAKVLAAQPVDNDRGRNRSALYWSPWTLFGDPTFVPFVTHWAGGLTDLAEDLGRKITIPL